MALVLAIAAALGGVGPVLWAEAAAAAAALVSRTTTRRVVVLLVTLGPTGAAGVAQLRPPNEAQIQALLSRTSDPVAAGDCTTDGTGATVCTLPAFTGWRAEWVEVARDVRQPLVERQLPGTPSTPSPDATVLLTSEWPRGTDADDPGRLDLALHTARQSVGLPAGFAYIASDDTGSVESTTTCSPVGQAREP